MVPNTKAEFDSMMGVNQKDYGSRAVVKRDVLRSMKKKGYKTSAFHKMPKGQLLAIARERGCDEE